MISSTGITPRARAGEMVAYGQPLNPKHERPPNPLSRNPHQPSLPVSNQPLSLQILGQSGSQHYEYTDNNYPSQQFLVPRSQSLDQYSNPYTPSPQPLSAKSQQSASAFEQSHSFSIDSSGPDKFAESFFAGTEHQENIINSNSHQEESSGLFFIPEPFVPLAPFPVDSQQTTPGFEQSYSLHLGGLNPNAPAGPFFASPENQDNTISGNSYQEQLNRGSSATRSQFLDPGPFVPYWGPFLPENQQPIFGLEQEQSQYQYANYTNNVLSIPQWPPFTAHQGSAINSEFLQDKSSNASELINSRPLSNPSRSSVLKTPENATHGSRSTPSQKFRCDKCIRPLAGPHKCSYEGRTLTIWCRGNNDKCLQKLTKRSDFNRHWNDVHADVELIRCPVPGCKKGFKRKDNLTQHRRLFHEQFIAKNRIRYGGGNARSPGSAEVEPVEG